MARKPPSDTASDSVDKRIQKISSRSKEEIPVKRPTAEN